MQMFYPESGQIVEQVAQRSGGTSNLGGHKNITGQGPEQLALTGPAR